MSEPITRPRWFFAMPLYAAGYAATTLVLTLYVSVAYYMFAIGSGIITGDFGGPLNFIFVPIAAFVLGLIVPMGFLPLIWATERLRRGRPKGLIVVPSVASLSVLVSVLAAINIGEPLPGILFLVLIGYLILGIMTYWLVVATGNTSWTAAAELIRWFRAKSAEDQELIES